MSRLYHQPKTVKVDSPARVGSKSGSQRRYGAGRRCARAPAPGWPRTWGGPPLRRGGNHDSVRSDTRPYVFRPAARLGEINGNRGQRLLRFGWPAEVARGGALRFPAGGDMSGGYPRTFHASPPASTAQAGGAWCGRSACRSCPPNSWFAMEINVAVCARRARNSLENGGVCWLMSFSIETGSRLKIRRGSPLVGVRVPPPAPAQLVVLQSLAATRLRWPPTVDSGPPDRFPNGLQTLGNDCSGADCWLTPWGRCAADRSVHLPRTGRTHPVWRGSQFRGAD